MPQDTENQATEIIQSLLGLIEHAIGQSESPALKTRLSLAFSLLGTLSDAFIPLLATHYNIAGILDGITKIEAGLAGLETGLQEVTDALKHQISKPQDINQNKNGQE